MNTSRSFRNVSVVFRTPKRFCRGFFNWYNQDHHHAGIGLMTPRKDQVHYGQADQVHAARQITLDGAFSRNPERFVKKGAQTARKADRDLDQSTEPPANQLSP